MQSQQVTAYLKVGHVAGQQDHAFAASQSRLQMLETIDVRQWREPTVASKKGHCGFAHGHAKRGKVLTQQALALGVWLVREAQS